MTLPALTSCLLLLTTLPQDDLAAGTPPPAAAPVEGGIAEDVEIMRRLLVRELTEACAPQLDAQQVGARSFTHVGFQSLSLQDWAIDVNGNPVNGWVRGAIDDSNGFHVPGTGVLFTIEGRVPVRQVVQTSNPVQVVEEGKDPWAEVEQQVRTGAEPKATQAQLWNFQFVDPMAELRLELDPDRVAQLIDAALATLAGYGHKLDLGADETVTICLHLKTGGDASMHYPWFTDVDGDSIQDVWIANTLMHYGTQDPADLEQRVIVQLPRQALIDLASRKGGAAEAKARAMIHTY